MKKPYSLGVYLTALVALVLVPLFGVAIYAGWQAGQHIQIHAADPHDAPMLAAAQQTMLNVLLWIGIVILLSLLAVRRFSRRHLTDNIKQLVAFTQRIANQDFAQSPEPTGGPAELCALTDSVQRMSANLQRALTDSHAAVAQLTKLNRIYAMLDAANKTILTGTLDREALCLESCRIAVTHGPFVLACIAPNEPREGAPRFVAAGAPADDFLREWNFPSTEAVPAFIATVLREGCACVRNDLAREEPAAPWRDAALRRGYCSAAAFPMRTGNRNFGAYVLFSEQAGTFDSEEAKLLGHLATNLAHAIQFNEQEERRLYAEQVREKSESWFRTITENSSDLIVVIDPQGLIRFVSHSVSQLLGHKSNDLLERAVWDYIHPDDIATLQGALAENLPHRGVFGPYQYRVRHQNQSWLWFEAVANNLLTDEAVRGIVINARDITPRKLAEETIRYRLTFEQKIAVISSRFVGGEDFDAVLQAALADMGSFRKADRAYLFLLRDGDAVMDNTHEWCAPGVSRQKDNLQNISTAAFPWWMAKLRNREIIRIPNVALLPPEAAAERAILGSQDIKSLLALPVYIGDKLGGFIGFDNVRTTGEWGNEDNSLLQVAAELIGRAIAQHRAEQALQESRELYRTIFQGSRAVQLLIDPHSGAIVDANPAATAFYGYTRDQLTTLRIWDINTLGEHETRQRMTAARDDSAGQFEFQHRLASGEIRHVQVYSGEVLIAGQPFLNSIILDITDRHRAEEEAKANHARLLSVLEAHNHPIYVSDPVTYEVLYTNRTTQDLLGDIRSRKCYEYFHDRTAPCPFCTNGQLLRQDDDKPIQWEHYNEKIHRWYQCNDRSITWPDGRRVRYEMAIDITERKQAEAALRFTQFAVDHSVDAALWMNSSGHFIYVNETACRTLGYSREELLTMSVPDIDPLYPRERWAENWNTLRQCKHQVIESRHRAKDGRTFPVEITDNFIEINGQTFNCAIVRDITERKQAEQALRQSEEQFHGAFEHASIGMALVSPTGQFLKINPALCTILGYTEAELLQRTFQDITHPDDLQADLAHVHQVLDGKLQTYEMEKRYFHKTGHVVWVQLSVSLVRTADGAPLHFVSQIQDITERKQAELQRTATLEILDTLNRIADLPNAVRHILEIIQRTAGVEAAAIRLASAGDFQYYSQIGFNERFVQAENNLCCRNPDGTIQLDANGQPLLECTCGLVLSGNTDPSNPLFTPAGSAWTNDSEKLLLIHPSADPRLHPRNRCIHEGYRSVALIPIHAGDTIVGLLQLNDHQADRFTPALITFLESLGASIGIALAQRHAQEQLRLSTERYQLVITGAASGIWDWDVANHRVHYSARWKALHDFAEHEINDSEEHWKQSIHPDDQPRVLAAVQNHFEGKTDAFEEEYRIRQKDGTYRWVLDRGKAIVNAAGQPVRMAGSEIDITGRKQAEEELRKRYEQLQRWQRATVGRELRMVELKQEVNHLSRAAGLPEPYPPHNTAAAANSQSDES